MKVQKTVTFSSQEVVNKVELQGEKEKRNFSNMIEVMADAYLESLKN